MANLSTAVTKTMNVAGDKDLVAIKHNKIPQFVGIVFNKEDLNGSFGLSIPTGDMFLCGHASVWHAPKGTPWAEAHEVFTGHTVWRNAKKGSSEPRLTRKGFLLLTQAAFDGGMVWGHSQPFATPDGVLWVSAIRPPASTKGTAKPAVEAVTQERIEALLLSIPDEYAKGSQ